MFSLKGFKAGRIMQKLTIEIPDEINKEDGDEVRDYAQNLLDTTDDWASIRIYKNDVVQDEIFDTNNKQ